MGVKLSQLDANQVLKAAFDDSTGLLRTAVNGSLVPEQYDEQDYTYVVAGNGVGEIESIIYKLDSSVVATVTYSYDISNRIINSKRT